MSTFICSLLSVVAVPHILVVAYTFTIDLVEIKPLCERGIWSAIRVLWTLIVGVCGIYTLFFCAASEAIYGTLSFRAMLLLEESMTIAQRVQMLIADSVFLLVTFGTFILFLFVRCEYKRNDGKNEGDNERQDSKE